MTCFSSISKLLYHRQCKRFYSDCTHDLLQAVQISYSSQMSVLFLQFVFNFYTTMAYPVSLSSSSSPPQLSLSPFLTHIHTSNRHSLICMTHILQLFIPPLTISKAVIPSQYLLVLKFSFSYYFHCNKRHLTWSVWCSYAILKVINMSLAVIKQFLQTFGPFFMY